MAALERAGAAFAAAGTRLGAIKGIVNGRYYDDPGYRQFGDVDLVVGFGDEDLAGALTALGLPPKQAQAADRLHRSRLSTAEFGATVDRARLDFHLNPFGQWPPMARPDAVHRLLREPDLGVAGVGSPTPELALLISLVHAFRDHGARLTGFADAIRIRAATAIDLQSFNTLADSQGLASVVAGSAQILAAEFGVAAFASLSPARAHPRTPMVGARLGYPYPANWRSGFIQLGTPQFGASGWLALATRFVPPPVVVRCVWPEFESRSYPLALLDISRERRSIHRRFRRQATEV